MWYYHSINTGHQGPRTRPAGRLWWPVVGLSSWSIQGLHGRTRCLRETCGLRDSGRCIIQGWAQSTCSLNTDLNDAHLPPQAFSFSWRVGISQMHGSGCLTKTRKETHCVCRCPARTFFVRSTSRSVTDLTEFSPLGRSPGTVPTAHHAGPPPPALCSVCAHTPVQIPNRHDPDRPAGGTTASMWATGDALSDAGTARSPRLPPPVNRACGRAAARVPPRAGTCPPCPPTGPGDAATRPCPSDVLMAMNRGVGASLACLHLSAELMGRGRWGRPPLPCCQPG